MCELHLAGSVLGLVVGACERGNEPSCSINGGGFLDYLNDYQLFNKTFPPWSSFQ
jgi:hypothetical protein